MPRSAPPRASARAAAGEISASAAAQRLGLTKQAIGLWTAKPGAPVRKVGASVFVRWPDFARWREQELMSGAKREAPAGSFAERRQGAEARAAEVSLQRAEMALARELGESVAVSDFGEAVGKILDICTAVLRAIPVRLSDFGPDVEAAAEAEVERGVVKLHQWDENVIDEDDPDDGPGAEAAA